MNVIGKEKWGPKAWHMLHAFSISDDLTLTPLLKKKYYIFYTSFLYVIPCLICKEHYSEILYNILPLNEEKITRKYLERWVFNAHNIVNVLLKKKYYTFKKCIKDNKEPRNYEIMVFIKAVYLGFDYENMCLYNFDQIYNFFINFCVLYPCKKIRTKLKKIINHEDFKSLCTPNELRKWFYENQDLWNLFLVNK